VLARVNTDKKVEEGEMEVIVEEDQVTLLEIREMEVVIEVDHLIHLVEVLRQVHTLNKSSSLMLLLELVSFNIWSMLGEKLTGSHWKSRSQD
jgi:hypothetical protein